MSDRLLKESDVLKAIDKRVEKLSKDPVFIRKNGIIDIMGVKKHILAIPSADRPQEWIPCSERLPELTIHENEPFIGEWDNSEPVLIYHKDNKYEYPYLIAQYTNGFENNEVGWTEMNDANEVIDVMAWMPLPKPYREENEE